MPTWSRRHIAELDPTKVDVIGLMVLVVVLAVLQFLLHGLHEILPHGSLAVAMLLGIPLGLLISRRVGVIGSRLRLLVSAYLVFLIAVSIVNALLLLDAVMRDSTDAPISLLIGGFDVMAINMLSFGLIYWWLDAADPAITAGGGQESPDFLFPQQAAIGSTWRPQLMDYVYVAFTNLLAFSPTDTMPLRIRTKTLFMIQSATSTFCAVVILGHAINSLPDSG